MKPVDIIEDLLGSIVNLVSKMFQISFEPVKVVKIPELDKPEVRKTVY
ncbi:hypothetical protein DCCM_3632 [Desulfocucumis palustris]|uniref:Uncharacterized protein n=1 Tax=Desulfocucumis palustris TaxID=1898651 RepID=A0A2L2XES2_9FIRM|nr:hypothetical protein [Desulfocucumis palustris]GBF34514.1 hypothetical protein DCCM_3632 [Desulfocucumis palustris]